MAQCWGERKRQQRIQQKTTQGNNETAPRTTILTMPRDNAGEIQALIDIVMNINGYTINDMIPNMNELIKNQLNARDKVNFELKKPFFSKSNSFQLFKMIRCHSVFAALGYV